ncbi:MAG: Clp protease ClpP [Succinivibrionaceae bacterium]|nr:Clp protease ClpP [Succinivibrionaceae bacterium]
MNKDRFLLRFDMKVEGEEAEITVYSVIDGDKWWGDETTPADFDKALKDAIKNGATRLNLRVNSPGGDVYSAVAMRSMIINSGFEQVRVMIEGLCASAATLFATVPGAHVVIAEGSEFMIHNPSTIAWGDAKEMQDTVDHLHKLEDQFHSMYAARTGQAEEQIKEWMDATTWFTAKEAVDYGFCDEMLEAEKQNKGRAVACVNAREMMLMRSAYKDVPEAVTVRDEAPATNKGSNDSSVAGVSSVNTTKEGNPNMEIKDITREQLLADNPALVDQIAQQAVAAERQRIQDILDAKMTGYDDMAEQAIKDGTDANVFMRNMIAAQKQKGGKFLEDRQKETAPAKNVAASAPEINTGDGAAEDAAAKQIAKFAEDMAYTGNSMY